MLILVSGEGLTDMGRCLVTDSCCGDDFEAGPMAWLVDQIVESSLGYPLLPSGWIYFVSKTKLSAVSKGLGPTALPGPKRPRETAYFYRNARAMAQLAQELAKNNSDEVVAVLFRDADGTQSAGRGVWQDKWDSMLRGFQHERFDTGVPMIPKPKSEAWLLCALKQSGPYRNCTSIEDASGNDNAPNSLKMQLAHAVGQRPTANVLCDLVRDRVVDASRIDMPSFLAFRKRLQAVL